MKKLFFLSAILTLFFVTAQAQTGNLSKSFEVFTLRQDTVVNTTSENIVFPRVFTDLYDVAWQLEFSNISGTSAGAAHIEGSNCITCNDWERLRSYTFSNTLVDTLFVFERFPMARMRVVYEPTGSHNTQVRNHVLARRRED